MLCTLTPLRNNNNSRNRHYFVHIFIPSLAQNPLYCIKHFFSIWKLLIYSTPLKNNNSRNRHYFVHIFIPSLAQNSLYCIKHFFSIWKLLIYSLLCTYHWPPITEDIPSYLHNHNFLLFNIQHSVKELFTTCKSP